MNWVETALMLFAPVYHARRQLEFQETQVKIEQRKLTLERINYAKESLRKYEAASKSGRMAMWLTPDTSANAENYGSLGIMRNRARALCRDNPWASHGVEVISTLVVGDGIRPQLNHLEDPEARSVTSGKDLWSDWAETPACDFEGERTMTDLQAAALESAVRDGDCFVIRHYLTPAQAEEVANQFGLKRMVPLRLQLLEADFLDENYNEVRSDGSKIIQGIEFDAAGRRVAYHFFKNHPGDTHTLSLSFVNRDRVRIPASRVRPLMKRDRLHQARGVTWFTKVMIRLRELDIFEDATLKKQQVAACFGAFIIDPNGQEEDSEDDEDTIEIKDKLESGSVEILPGGKDIRFPSLPAATDYPEFTKAQLRAIAAGLGITYEALTQDLTNTNFSSGKMGSNGMGKKIKKWQTQIIINQMMEPVFIWWREAADLATPANMNMAKLWAQWTTPAMPLVDPGKEIAANKEAIDSCQTTVSEVLRSQGRDPEAVFNERAGELKRMKELQILPAAQGSVGGSAGAPKKPKSNDQEDGNADATND